MQEFKIVEWNINHATNYNNQTTIPGFVFQEIKDISADLTVIVEISKSCKNADIFLNMLKENGYDLRITDNKRNNQNDVLVAWKCEKFIFEEFCYQIPQKNNSIPEIMAVRLRERVTGNTIVVCGIRIRLMNGSYEEQWDKRREQLENGLTFIDQFKKINDAVIILGDFNNNYK